MLKIQKLIKKFIYLTNLEKLLSSPKVSTKMQEKKIVLVLCLTVAAKTEWGKKGGNHDNTGKNKEREFLQLRNKLVNSEEPFSLQKRIEKLSLNKSELE